LAHILSSSRFSVSRRRAAPKRAAVVLGREEGDQGRAVVSLTRKGKVRWEGDDSAPVQLERHAIALDVERAQKAESNAGSHDTSFADSVTDIGREVNGMALAKAEGYGTDPPADTRHGEARQAGRESWVLLRCSWPEDAGISSDRAFAGTLALPSDGTQARLSGLVRSTGTLTARARPSRRGRKCRARSKHSGLSGTVLRRG
jgi:hypothetical protein